MIVLYTVIIIRYDTVTHTVPVLYKTTGGTLIDYMIVRWYMYSSPDCTWLIVGIKKTGLCAEGTVSYSVSSHAATAVGTVSSRCSHG